MVPQSGQRYLSVGMPCSLYGRLSVIMRFAETGVIPGPTLTRLPPDWPPCDRVGGLMGGCGKVGGLMRQIKNRRHSFATPGPSGGKHGDGGRVGTLESIPRDLRIGKFRGFMASQNSGMRMFVRKCGSKVHPRVLSGFVIGRNREYSPRVAPYPISLLILLIPFRFLS